MIGELDQQEIDHLLQTQQVGRLGVCGDGQVYIFPISIGYDGHDIYGHSGEGLKVTLMRRTPAVCLEVEDITSAADWRTVMAHGVFEELRDTVQREAALSRIALQGARPLPPSMAPFSHGDDSVVVFRIKVESVTGRYERDEVFPRRGG